MKVIPETLHVHYIRYLPFNTQEEIEETKGVIKIRKSEEWQHNGRKKKYICEILNNVV